ncbi:hypothetical protein GCM10017778_15180 [Streptomyces vinaceus]|nr:hypothetical protein GCM10017778_15180 [Streptomyces vinaceus]
MASAARMASSSGESGVAVAPDAAEVAAWAMGVMAVTPPRAAAIAAAAATVDLSPGLVRTRVMNAPLSVLPTVFTGR